jgi:hypothetical protein
MSEGHRWKDDVGIKSKYLEKSLSHCHFIVDKSQVDLPGIEAGSPLFCFIHPVTSHDVFFFFSGVMET